MERASGASLRSAPSAPGYSKGNLIKIKEAPSAPAYLKGALMLTFHTAMKSWKKSERSAEKK